MAPDLKQRPTVRPVPGCGAVLGSGPPPGSAPPPAILFACDSAIIAPAQLTHAPADRYLGRMETWEHNGLRLYRFEGLKRIRSLSHAITTRQGGVSKKPFDYLNLGMGQDDEASVNANLELLQAVMDLPKMVWARQVHGTRIVAVDGTESGPVENADGLATDRPGVGLLIQQADCQAVILAAPGKAVANLHVGWRGNVANMPGAGVQFMRQRYGLAPHELRAAVSPSLGPCCAQFINHASELGPGFTPYQSRPDYFNLWKVTVDQLVRAGIKRERIEVAGLCTKCRQEFYSYRREKLTGRFGTLIALV